MYVCIVSTAVENFKPAILCESDDDCNHTNACVKGSCVDPCTTDCPLAAQCRVEAHRPICDCGFNDSHCSNSTSNLTDTVEIVESKTVSSIPNTHFNSDNSTTEIITTTTTTVEFTATHSTENSTVSFTTLNTRLTSPATEPTTSTNNPVTDFTMSTNTDSTAVTWTVPITELTSGTSTEDTTIPSTITSATRDIPTSTAFTTESQLSTNPKSTTYVSTTFSTEPTSIMSTEETTVTSTTVVTDSTTATTEDTTTITTENTDSMTSSERDDITSQLPEYTTLKSVESTIHSFKDSNESFTVEQVSIPSDLSTLSSGITHITSPEKMSTLTLQSTTPLSTDSAESTTTPIAKIVNNSTVPVNEVTQPAGTEKITTISVESSTESSTDSFEPQVTRNASILNDPITEGTDIMQSASTLGVISQNTEPTRHPFTESDVLSANQTATVPNDSVTLPNQITENTVTDKTVTNKLEATTLGSRSDVDSTSTPVILTTHSLKTTLLTGNDELITTQSTINLNKDHVIQTSTEKNGDVTPEPLTTQFVESIITTREPNLIDEHGEASTLSSTVRDSRPTTTGKITQLGDTLVTSDNPFETSTISIETTDKTPVQITTLGLNKLGEDNKNEETTDQSEYTTLKLETSSSYETSTSAQLKNPEDTTWQSFTLHQNQPVNQTTEGSTSPVTGFWVLDTEVETTLASNQLTSKKPDFTTDDTVTVQIISTTEKSVQINSNELTTQNSDTSVNHPTTYKEFTTTTLNSLGDSLPEKTTTLISKDDNTKSSTLQFITSTPGTDKDYKTTVKYVSESTKESSTLQSFTNSIVAVTTLGNEDITTEYVTKPSILTDDHTTQTPTPSEEVTDQISTLGIRDHTSTGTDNQIQETSTLVTSLDSQHTIPSLDQVKESTTTNKYSLFENDHTTNDNRIESQTTEKISHNVASTIIPITAPIIRDVTEPTLMTVKPASFDEIGSTHVNTLIDLTTEKVPDFYNRITSPQSHTVTPQSTTPAEVYTDVVHTTNIEDGSTATENVLLPNSYATTLESDKVTGYTTQSTNENFETERTSSELFSIVGSTIKTPIVNTTEIPDFPSTQENMVQTKAGTTYSHSNDENSLTTENVSESNIQSTTYQSNQVIEQTTKLIQTDFAQISQEFTSTVSSVTYGTAESITVIPENQTTQKYTSQEHTKTTYANINDKISPTTETNFQTTGVQGSEIEEQTTNPNKYILSDNYTTQKNANIIDQTTLTNAADITASFDLQTTQKTTDPQDNITTQLNKNDDSQTTVVDSTTPQFFPTAGLTTTLTLQADVTTNSGIQTTRKPIDVNEFVTTYDNINHDQPITENNAELSTQSTTYRTNKFEEQSTIPSQGDSEINEITEKFIPSVELTTLTPGAGFTPVPQFQTTKESSDSEEDVTTYTSINTNNAIETIPQSSIESTTHQSGELTKFTLDNSEVNLTTEKFDSNVHTTTELPETVDLAVTKFQTTQKPVNSYGFETTYGNIEGNIVTTENVPQVNTQNTAQYVNNVTEQTTILIEGNPVIDQTTQKFLPTFGLTTQTSGVGVTVVSESQATENIPLSDIEPTTHASNEVTEYPTTNEYQITHKFDPVIRTTTKIPEIETVVPIDFQTTQKSIIVDGVTTVHANVNENDPTTENTSQFDIPTTTHKNIQIIEKTTTVSQEDSGIHRTTQKSISTVDMTTQISGGGVTVYSEFQTTQKSTNLENITTTYVNINDNNSQTTESISQSNSQTTPTRSDVYYTTIKFDEVLDHTTEKEIDPSSYITKPQITQVSELTTAKPLQVDIKYTTVKGTSDDDEQSTTEEPRDSTVTTTQKLSGVSQSSITEPNLFDTPITTQDSISLGDHNLITTQKLPVTENIITSHKPHMPDLMEYTTQKVTDNLPQITTSSNAQNNYTLPVLSATEKITTVTTNPEPFTKSITESNDISGQATSTTELGTVTGDKNYYTSSTPNMITNDLLSTTKIFDPDDTVATSTISSTAPSGLDNTVETSTVSTTEISDLETSTFSLTETTDLDYTVKTSTLSTPVTTDAISTMETTGTSSDTEMFDTSSKTNEFSTTGTPTPYSTVETDHLTSSTESLASTTEKFASVLTTTESNFYGTNDDSTTLSPSSSIATETTSTPHQTTEGLSGTVDTSTNLMIEPYANSEATLSTTQNIKGIFCSEDNDCIESKSCIDEICQNPCEVSSPCLVNLKCEVINHRPVCSCSADHQNSTNCSVLPGKTTSLDGSLVIFFTSLSSLPPMCLWKLFQCISIKSR